MVNAPCESSRILVLLSLGGASFVVARLVSRQTVLTHVNMATMLLGTTFGVTSAARVSAVRPRAGAGARVALDVRHAASPTRVVGLGRRHTSLRVSIRASLGVEGVVDEKPETDVPSMDAQASVSRDEAWKQFGLHATLVVGVTALALAFPCASLAAAKAKSVAAVAGPIPFLPFTHNQILRAVNLGSLPAWASMVLLPRWRHTKKITLAVAVAYSLLYATLAYVLFSDSVLSLDLKSLTTAEGISRIFSDSTAVLAGWAHFIVFDLFTARFFVEDSARVGIPHIAVVPCILGCMFFGPVGLLTYIGVKKAHAVLRDRDASAPKTYSF